MPRPVSDDPRVFPVCVRLTASESEALDMARGEQTRSDYVRSMLTASQVMRRIREDRE
jgi:hypothetical protein